MSYPAISQNQQSTIGQKDFNYACAEKCPLPSEL